MQSSTPSRHTRRRLALQSQARLTGDKLSPAQVASIEARIQETPTGCWEWVGSCDNDGYPQVVWQTKRYRVHKLWYEHRAGAPVAPGDEVDHVCNNRRCLLHLEAVSKSENLRRRFARDVRPLFNWRSARDYRLSLTHLDSIEAER
jgi:hypothetical protein